MEIPTIVYIGALAVLWALNEFLKRWAAVRAQRLQYERELQSVLTDPNSQVKGRFD